MVSDSVGTFKRDTNIEGVENYRIRDNTTGMEYDIRDQHTSFLLVKADQKLTKLPKHIHIEPWSNWWKKKHKHISDFLSAVEKGKIDVIADLLDINKHGDLAVDINVKGLNNFTPLHFAALEGQIAIVKYLLENGAEVNSVTNSLRTPLHVACTRDFLDIIKVLVEEGANINAQDENGDTPLHLLSKLGHTESVKWFLSQGPDLSIKDKYGELPFDVASTVGIRQLFTEDVKQQMIDNYYSRTVMDGLLLHNNRADVVKSFIFKAQLMEVEDKFYKEESKVNSNNKVISAAHSSHNKRRISNILKAAERLSTVIIEETKQSFEKSEMKEDLVGPNDFDVLSIIGKGSFGQVYLVKLKKDNTLYAMKVLDKKKIISQNSFRYVKAEKEIMRISKHPFIVKLHFTFQNADKLFMIMQYCPG